MATTALKIENQIDWSGLAILATDVVATGSIYVGGNAIAGTELAFVDGVTAGTAAANKAVVLGASKDIATITSATITTMTGNVVGNVTGDVTGNVTGNHIGSVNPAVVMTKGTGVSAMETHVSGVITVGTLKTTRILVDLTGLVGSATDLDIIGNTTQAANAHMGQVTVAVNGTMVGGRVTCLEVPAGGTADIDFYSATVGTGAQDTDVTTLTETALITSGGAWTSGATKGMTAVPPANDYIYICNGAASGGTFTAGKFLIELFGT